ncbi:MAG: 30S ribosomal protein S8 [Candidatus Blackburnbacteria bacterium]|nr:30S ribosomal protein S8 [Candidatus Blackburnbacteria bacterium]
MITYPVGDLLTRVRNAVKSRNREVSAPYSKLKYAVSLVLKKEGYLSDVKKQGNELLLTLTYKRRQPLITGIRNVSRPGMRIYRKADTLPRPLGGAGISIVSTPEGVMSSKEARKKNLGGEVLGEVW